jgi:hypothetical protein
MSTDQVDVVIGLHDQVVRGLHHIGMTVQSTTAGQALPAEMKCFVDRLTAVLDAAIRSAQMAAYELPGPSASARTSGGPTITAPVGETGQPEGSPG